MSLLTVRYCPACREKTEHYTKRITAELQSHQCSRCNRAYLARDERRETVQSKPQQPIKEG